MKKKVEKKAITRKWYIVYEGADSYISKDPEFLSHADDTFLTFDAAKETLVEYLSIRDYQYGRAARAARKLRKGDV